MSASPTTHAEPTAPAGEAHHAGHSGDLMYIKVAVFLGVLTAIEVATYFVDFQGAFVPVLLGLMMVKFFTVIWYFMHLKFDSKLFRRVFYAGLLMAIAVYVVALTTFRLWEGGA